jgi:hypothetical protein
VKGAVRLEERAARRDDLVWLMIDGGPHLSVHDVPEDRTGMTMLPGRRTGPEVHFHEHGVEPLETTRQRVPRQLAGPPWRGSFGGRHRGRAGRELSPGDPQRGQEQRERNRYGHANHAADQPAKR